MHVRVDSYWTAMAGNRDDEYEDAYAAGPGPAPDTGGYRFAVADGATESSYSRSWAELLAWGAVEGRLSLSDSSSLAELQRDWDDSIATRNLPWFAEEKVRQGAFAALVVFELHADPDRIWRAEAVGDSCLFHLRAGELQVSFPLRQATDFDHCPYLIGSRSDCGEVVSRLTIRDGAWEPGDEFLLMSDALARWFLTELEAGGQPRDEIARLPEPGQPDGFREWVDGLRQTRSLRNDDMTLIRIAVAE